MSEKMKQDQIMLNAIAEIMRGTDCKFSTEMIDLVESLASAASPAQEPVTTEPVAWQWWTKIGLINMTSSRSEAESWRTKGADVRPLYAIPAPPQPGPEEIAKHLYTKFCADPSIEWQDAPEKLKDVWRRYAGEIAALSGEEGKSG